MLHSENVPRMGHSDVYPSCDNTLDRCAGFDFRQSVQPTLTSANGVFLHNGRVKNDARGIERSLLSMFSTGI